MKAISEGTYECTEVIGSRDGGGRAHQDECQKRCHSYSYTEKQKRIISLNDLKH